jgi:cytochrome c2
MRYALVFSLTALVIVSPATETPASQKNDHRERPPKLLNYSKMTTQQLVNEGEKIIFGGIGQSNVQGAMGKAQCPLCHAVREGQYRDSAPNLIGVTKRAAERLQDPRYRLGEPEKRPTVQHEAFPGSGTATNTLEYLAESDVCHSCFVMAGWGVRGSNDTDTGAPSSVEPPISLSIDELIAMTTWFYVRDGKKPPLPQEIEDAYKKFVAPPKWKILVQTRSFPKLEDLQTRGQVLATGHEAVSDIFHFAQCHLCHTIPGVQGATGKLGPPLGLKTTAVSRLKDPLYRGKATTPREYVYESIHDPSAHVVLPFPDNVMPKDYGSRLSALAVDKMVTYILTFENEPAPNR